MTAYNDAYNDAMCGPRCIQGKLGIHSFLCPSFLGIHTKGVKYCSYFTTFLSCSVMLLTVCSAAH